jgi:hypothetical protein
MFQAIKDERKRRKQIKELDAFIDKTIAEEVKTATTKQEEGEAYSRAFSMVEEEWNERDYLRQRPWLRRLRKEGILVPQEYFEERPRHLKPVLNATGETWVRGEYRRLGRLTIEFWFKLVVPILALILSIIALVKKSH